MSTGIGAIDRNVARQRMPRGGLVLGLVFLSLVLGLFASARGQGGLEEFPTWSSGPQGYARSVALGDVDGDGDLDLVCGRPGQSTLYRNLGTTFETLPTWSGQSDYALSVALGDVDGDGDLDLVCGNATQSTRLYRNLGMTFETTPAWSSGPQDYTQSVALGDVDGDGDLDLVCGNYGRGATLYRNLGMTFETDPAWSSGPQDYTQSVALGDVDGDGDLDLVCGNGRYDLPQSTTLYRNLGTTFETSPSWYSGRQDITNSVALGDVDGDGDLDLVCGNHGQDWLYRNQGTTFEIDPAWVSEPGGLTRSVALGDVDGDGALDLVCGIENQSTRLYRNLGMTFATTPAWSSGPQDYTQSVALGDVDGDGDLDLVIGNSGQSRLYRNQRMAFGIDPAWSSGPQDNTLAVALGDVDADGDLDLICGNATQSTRLYRSLGTTLATTPAWSSGLQDRTTSVSLGDVDGDGDLDLVCGNFGQSTTLYRNLGTTFETDPAWSSGLQDATQSVALGDVDADGDLDIVCGNNGQSTTLYRNLGTTFETDPAWSSGPQDDTRSVALGDVDRDGDLDLVCGNYGQSTRLYRNLGTTFETDPVWFSGPQDYARSVALGDVDGDGDLDLVCGNQGARTTLYRNLGTTFETDPSWSSGPWYLTTSLALGDVDADGDLDLVCGNETQSTRLYRNLGALFEASPSWSSDRQDRTYSVALGDVDADGDLDLVCGNAGQSTTLYSALGRPPFRGDPLQPTNQLPNNSAFLRRVRVEETGRNLYRVRFAAVDVESDAVWIVADQAFRGITTWSPIRLAGGGNKVGPVASSPAGIEHTFAWDVGLLPIDRKPVVLRLRAISNPRRVGAIQHVAAYFTEAEVRVQHPAIASSVSALVLPVVTVGDTVSMHFILRNDGNEPLAVTGAALPYAALGLGSMPPFDLSPSSSIELDLDYRPVVPEVVSGRVEIQSNDPITPSLSIAITGEARGLDFSTRPLVSGPDIPLGEPLTVLVVPGEQVHIERATLYHRAAVGSGTFRPILLSRPGRDFVGVIPGADITENGLEFYVEVENSGIRRTDPRGAPEESVFTAAIRLPEGIVAEAQPHGRQGFLQGRSVDVQVEMPEGLLFRNGALHYREAGQSVYQLDSLRVAGTFAVGTIPESFVGTRGVEYWVEVQTATRVLSDPPSPQAPNFAPLRIRTTVANVQEPVMHGGQRYRMVSFPLDFGSSFTGTLQAQLSNEFGLYDPIRWRVFRYLNGRNVEVTEGGDDFRPEPGRAFWLVSRDNHQVDTAPIGGLSVPADSPYVITLAPDSWNQVGDPFAFRVAWSDSSCSSCEAPKIYDPTNPGDPYRQVSVLEPFEGFFVYNTSTEPAQLRLWPVEATAAQALAAERAGAVPVGWWKAGTKAPDATALDSWALRIRAHTAESADEANLLGVHPRAADDRDGLDDRELPSPPGPWVQLAFLHPEWPVRPGVYRHDIRTSGVDGHDWEAEVRSAAAEEVVLEPLPETPLPEDLAVRLIDRELGSSVDLRVAGSGALESSYQLLSFGAERPYRVTILAGTSEYVSREAEQLVATVPSRLVLDQNAPNPFNATTRIRFGLPRADRVGLVIYNVRGERVIRLLQGESMPAGFHAVLWHGTDEAGRELPSGVYLCRLTAGSATLTTRAVLLK